MWDDEHAYDCDRLEGIDVSIFPITHFFEGIHNRAEHTVSGRRLLVKKGKKEWRESERERKVRIKDTVINSHVR